MSLYISGLSVEYQTCPKFCDLGSPKISALLDLASLSYRQDTITRSAEKTVKPAKQRVNLSTILAIDLASKLNTKVVHL